MATRMSLNCRCSAYRCRHRSTSFEKNRKLWTGASANALHSQCTQSSCTFETELFFFAHPKIRAFNSLKVVVHGFLLRPSMLSAHYLRHLYGLQFVSPYDHTKVVTTCVSVSHARAHTQTQHTRPILFICSIQFTGGLLLTLKYPVMIFNTPLHAVAYERWSSSSSKCESRDQQRGKHRNKQTQCICVFFGRR